MYYLWLIALLIFSPSAYSQTVETVSITEKKVKASPKCLNEDPYCDCKIAGNYPQIVSRNPRFESANQQIRIFVDDNDTTKTCATQDTGEAALFSYTAHTLGDLISLAVTVEVGEHGAHAIYTNTHYINVDAASGNALSLRQITTEGEMAELNNRMQEMIAEQSDKIDSSTSVDSCLKQSPGFTMAGDKVIICPTTSYGGISRVKNGLDMEIPVAFFKNTKYFQTKSDKK